MKSISLILLSIMMITLAACTTSEKTKDTQTQTTTVETIQQPPTITEKSNNVENQSHYEVLGMPEPFRSSGGDERRTFYGHTEFKFDSAFPDSAFTEYLGRDCREDWINYDSSRLYNITSLMDYPNIFYLIITYNIPNDVIIKNFEGWVGDDDYILFFTEEEIAALLTRDEAIVLAQFASDKSIIIGDKAYPPNWVYTHTPEDYEEVGITPEMIEEKLELYAEFSFTDDAETAFEEKLSEFVEEEVSFRQIRERNRNRRNRG